MANTQSSHTRPRIIANNLLSSTDPTRLSSLRSRDFVRLCNRIARSSGGALTQREIIGKALASEAPAYYVDYDYALRVTPQVMKMPREVAGRYSRGKWLEIADRCRAELASRRSKDLGAALVNVLASGRASGFFLSPSTALRILQRANTAASGTGRSDNLTFNNNLP